MIFLIRGSTESQRVELQLSFQLFFSRPLYLLLRRIYCIPIAIRMEVSYREENENGLKRRRRALSTIARLEIIANTVNHILIGITSVYITWYSLKVGFQEYQTSHAYCCTIGYQLLMSEGILVMYSKNTFTMWLRNRDPKRRIQLQKRIHWILQVIASLFVLYGVPTMIYNREITGRKHFHNTHAITGKTTDNISGEDFIKSNLISGLISFILLILTVLSGSSALFSLELKRYIKPVFSKTGHNIISTLCYIIGMAALISAYVTRSWLKKADPGEVRIIMIWCLRFILILTLIGPLKTLYRQFRK